MSQLPCISVPGTAHQHHAVRTPWPSLVTTSESSMKGSGRLPPRRERTVLFQLLQVFTERSPRNLAHIRIVTCVVVAYGAQNRGRIALGPPLSVGSQMMAALMSLLLQLVGRRFFRYEFLTRILPSRNVNTSHPFTSTLWPSLSMPVNIHSDTPR